MDVHQAVVTTRLGEFDKEVNHESQSMPCDYFVYNEPLRDKSMTPRLQAKIPKCFAWDIYPGYDYYLWLDGNISLAHPDALKYFRDNCEDIVVLEHPTHKTIHWEYRYNWRGLNNNAPSNYLTERYTNELLDEIYEVVKDEKYAPMINGGIFMYRNTPQTQALLKEWFYYITRYTIMDQLAWAYLLKKSDLKVNILPDKYNDCKWLKVERHSKHG